MTHCINQRPQGTISGNIHHYATALHCEFSKLGEEERGTAMQALSGILAEVERVEGLELLPVMDSETGNA